MPLFQCFILRYTGVSWIFSIKSKSILVSRQFILMVVTLHFSENVPSVVENSRSFRAQQYFFLGAW